MKVIEVLSNSNVSWEDATSRAVAEAGKTIKNIRSVYVNEMSAVVDDNAVTEYRVNAKITFQVRD